MRVLIYSRAFRPSIGGLETMMELLADGFSRSGHRVVVATTTPGPPEEDGVFEVVRNPSAVALWRLARTTDVCLCASISLRGLPPILASGTPTIVVHHGWYRGTQPAPWLAALKNGVSHLVTNVFASQAVARRIPTDGHVIPNAYDDRQFHAYPDVDRGEDLIVVARLVSEKGVDILLYALGELGGQGLRPNLTVVGAGPEQAALQALTVSLGLSEQVRFRGSLTGEPLAREIARHRVMVVPSSYEEPFGIVALEGIACGCMVVGTDGGGLPEAIGPCGLIARRGDAADLARQIGRALDDTTAHAAMRAAAEVHLRRHRREQVVAEYLDVLTAAAEGKRTIPT